MINVPNSGNRGKKRVANLAKPFICSAAAACFASIAIQPIDTLKTTLQLPEMRNKGFIELFRQLFSSGKLMTLYRGLSAALMRQLTYGTARLALHRNFSDYLMKRNNNIPIPFYQKILCAAASGTVGVFIGNPLDVSLVRMQSDVFMSAERKRNYKHVFDAVRQILKFEGVSSLYSGLSANVLRGVSMNIGMIACNDQLKEMIRKYVPSLSKSTNDLIAAGLTTMTTAVISLPFDFVKSRLQNMRLDPLTGKYPYAGVVDCFVKTYKEDGNSNVLVGAKRFFKGFYAYYGRCAPHAMIIILSLDLFNNQYDKYFELNA